MKGFIRLLIVLLFAGSLPSKAQTFLFSGPVEVSLLTCDPGKAVYARFGHTALRIKDFNGRDLAFNYGIFDFRTTNFYWKFLKGETDYLLGVYPTEYFLEEYHERGSGVREQVLNLTGDEKQRLIALLEENYLPENRMYRYNFVFDNCATRPGMMLQKALDGLLSYESSYSSETYRSLINQHIADDAWLSLGINLVFGMEADQPVNEGGAGFLPGLLLEDLQLASVVGYNGEKNPRKLVISTSHIVGPFPEVSSSTPFFIHPLFIATLWLLAGLWLSFRKQKVNRYLNFFDLVLYVVTTLGGLLIFMLSFFSEHPLVAANWHLLWLNPLNFIPAFLLWKKSAARILQVYNGISLLLVLAAGVIFALQLQQIPVAVLPVLLLLIVRTSCRLGLPTNRFVEFSAKGLKWKN